MFIQHQFLFVFGVELQNTLLKEMGLMGEDRSKKCEEYTVEDPQCHDRFA